MHDERKILSTAINRRALLGGIAGAATLAVGGAALVSAQTATPGATSSESSTRGAKLESRVKTELAAVKADRDAVASKIDTSMVDRLLAFATDLEGRASTAVATSGTAGTAATPAAGGTTGTTSARTGMLRELAAAGWTGEAARAEILAQLSAFGLPSQQAEVSKRLAATYAAITADAAAIKTANNADATSAQTMAQDLYTSAHDAYGAGNYAQAAKGDLSAGAMLRVAKMLSGQGKLESGMGKRASDGAGGAAPSRMRERERQRMQRQKGNGKNPGTAPGSESGTPVAVPSPTF